MLYRMDKRLLLSLAMAFGCLKMSHAQTTVWSEDFDGNGGAGSNWSTSPLNFTVGANDANANIWYISGTENGNSAGSCGSSGSDQSLHVGSVTLGDIGAAYDASSGTITNVRSTSQNINTTGHTNLTLQFNYIENGDLTMDNCVVEVSTNGGSSYSTLFDPAKTATACAPQGLWTASSTALPVSCENIANLRIAYRWVNNDDFSGTDPSFAVDDISITTPLIVLPLELLQFDVTSNRDYVGLEWRTASEQSTSHFAIERSSDVQFWTTVDEVQAAGNSSSVLAYSSLDQSPPTGTNYYRLKMVDLDGKYAYSAVQSVVYEPLGELQLLPNPTKDKVEIHYPNIGSCRLQLVAASGKEVFPQATVSENSVHWNIENLPKGVYVVLLTTANEVLSKKLVVH